MIIKNLFTFLKNWLLTLFFSFELEKMIQTNRLVFIRLISLMVLSEVTVSTYRTQNFKILINFLVFYKKIKKNFYLKAKSICNGSPKCGYTKKEGLGYYKIYTNAKTWNEARQSCLQDGAHLAIFNSEMERMVSFMNINFN